LLQYYYYNDHFCYDKRSSTAVSYTDTKINIDTVHGWQEKQSLDPEDRDSPECHKEARAHKRY
jgi:hypothetical protein